eukprot:scaffold731_cov261-Pinguiococcus_pyrenoidosus.AAC.36
MAPFGQQRGPFSIVSSSAVHPLGSRREGACIWPTAQWIRQTHEILSAAQSRTVPQARRTGAVGRPAAREAPRSSQLRSRAPRVKGGADSAAKPWR